MKPLKQFKLYAYLEAFHLLKKYFRAICLFYPFSLKYPTHYLTLQHLEPTVHDIPNSVHSDSSIFQTKTAFEALALFICLKEIS